MGFYAFQERGIERRRTSMAGVWIARTLTLEQRRRIQSIDFMIANEQDGQRKRVAQIGVHPSSKGTVIKVAGHFKNPAQVKRAAIELKKVVYEMLGLKTIGCRLSNYWLLSRMFAPLV